MNERFNVGFICPVPPDKNGLTNYIKRFKILSKRDDLKCFIFTETENPYPVDDCRIVQIPKGFLFSIIIIFLAVKFRIKILDVQYIYGLYGKGNNILLRNLGSAYFIISFLILCRVFRIRSVVTMHSIISDLSKDSVLNEMKKFSYLNSAIRLFNRFIVFFSDSLVVLSDNQYKMLESYSKNSKLHLIHHGIDTFNVVREPHSYFNFLYIGMIRPNKGIDILLDAFKRLGEKQKNVQLIIAGSGDVSTFSEYITYFKSVKAKINDMQQRCNLKFYEGWIREEQISELLKIADVIIFPYIDAANEVSGAAFSYASAGIPYICSDIPRFNSSFSNGVNAVFFECCSVNSLYKAMETVMNDLELRNKLSENLKTMSEKFSWKKNAEAYYNLYLSLTN
ncbi:MAG: glycosyltransferase family 4 protein [Caldisphaera sp.]